MAIQSNQNGTFGIQLYTIVTNTTDAAPNSTPPDPARVCRLLKLNPAVPQLTLYCVLGTSLAAVPWVLEETTGLWIKAAAVQTSTLGAGALVLTPRIDKAQIFWQVTTNTACTKFGFIYG